MLARVATSLYWMSRYLERAEHTVRLLEVNLNLMLDEGEDTNGRRWTRVLNALGNPKDLDWQGDAYGLARALMFGEHHAASIMCCISSARENARQVREQISSDQWQRLNRLYHEVTQQERDSAQDVQLADFLLAAMEGVHLFQGVTDSTMGHGEGWHFIQLGRYLERASATVRLLNVYPVEFWQHADRAPESTDYLEWIGLLRSCTAFEAYCRVYTADVSPDRILEFLLLDAKFPHAIRYSVDALQTALEAIHREGGGTRRGESLKRIGGRLQAQLGFADVQEIAMHNVVEYLQAISEQLQLVNAEIFHQYFDYPIVAALATSS